MDIRLIVCIYYLANLWENWEQFMQQREPGETERKSQTWEIKTARRGQIIRKNIIFIEMVIANVYWALTMSPVLNTLNGLTFI